MYLTHATQADYSALQRELADMRVRREQAEQQLAAAQTQNTSRTVGTFKMGFCVLSEM